jgi:hypothetical protein
MLAISSNGTRTAGVSAERRRVGVERLLTAQLAGAQHVQAHPAYDSGQPTAEVLDVARARPAQPKPGLLHGVIGLGERAEHPEGHGP